MFPSGITSDNGTFLFIILGTGQYVDGKQVTTEQRQINLIDNISIKKGSNQLKFGVDYRWLAPYSSPAAYHQFAAFTGVNFFFQAEDGIRAGTVTGVQTCALPI